MIVRLNVFLQPIVIGSCRIGDDILAIELMCLLLVRTDPVHDIQTRCYQSAKTFFAESLCFCGPLTLGNIKVYGEGFHWFAIRCRHGGHGPGQRVPRAGDPQQGLYRREHRGIFYVHEPHHALYFIGYHNARLGCHTQPACG